MFFALKLLNQVLVYIRLLFLMLALYISFQPFTFKLFVSLYLRYEASLRSMWLVYF